MIRLLAAIALLAFQVGMIGYARFVPSRYFCWAPMDSQNLYEISVLIRGRELDAEEIGARYRQPAAGGNWQAIQHVLDKVEQYEETYGHDDGAEVVVTYTVNGRPRETWTWPPPSPVTSPVVSPPGADRPPPGQLRRFGAGLETGAP